MPSMIGYRDVQHMLDSAVVRGLCCPNCYGPGRLVTCDDGQRRCVQCLREKEVEVEIEEFEEVE